MSREEIHTKSIIEKNELINKPFYKRQWVKEIFIFLVALLVYQVSRALAIGDADIAFKHAHQIIALEKMMGIFTEIPVQQFFLENQELLKALNAFYIRAHLPVTILFFVWMFNKRKEFYPTVRNIFLVANGIAILFYIFYPCAPPRMINEEGFVDTLLVISEIDLYEGKLSNTFNQYAAVPSMHFGYSLFVGFVSFFLAPNLLIKILASIYPIFVLIVIVATGNHFYLDAVIGGLVMMAAYPVYVGWMKTFKADTFKLPKLVYMR